MGGTAMGASGNQEGWMISETCEYEITIDAAELAVMLNQWRIEYGWGGMPRSYPGVSPCQSIADFHGRAPKITGFRPSVILGSVADVIEAHVKSLEPACWNEMAVLRCEYLGPQHQPIEARLDRLKAIGLNQSASTYYRRLDAAQRCLLDKINSKGESL